MGTIFSDIVFTRFRISIRTVELKRLTDGPLTSKQIEYLNGDAYSKMWREGVCPEVIGVGMWMWVELTLTYATV